MMGKMLIAGMGEGATKMVETWPRYWMPWNDEQQRFDLSDEPTLEKPDRKLVQGWRFVECVLVPVESYGRGEGATEM
jgi:hypothetical protein